MAIAGTMSVSRLTRSSWRALSGDRPEMIVPARVKPTSPRLPPTRMAKASRTDAHMARPSTMASMIVSMRSSVTTRSAAARAAGVPRRPRATPA
jgi:hypothetical protein